MKYLLNQSDIIGGLSGATIGNCATKVISESVGKSVGKEIVKEVIKSEISMVTQSALAHGLSRIFIEGVEKDSKYQNSQRSTVRSSSTSQQRDASRKSEAPNTSSTSNSGDQPPNNNQNNNNKQHTEEETETHWDLFLKIFKKKTLEDIILKGKNIFKGLNTYQKKLEDRDVTFQNFQTLAKFVVAYVHEQMAHRSDGYNQVPANFLGFSDIFNTRRQQLAKITTSEIAESISALLDLSKSLANKINDLMTTINPRFTNTFAAVYHYFKHKFVAEKNRTFTPGEYFALAREMLTRLYALPRFSKLIESGQRRIVYERYYAGMDRRLIIVLTIQVGIWKLSSCYWTDIIYKDDKDGDEWINDEKFPRE